MVYYSKSVYKLVGYRKSKTKNKMYDAVLRPRHYSGKDKHIPFGDKRYSNYRDTTGLNLYPNLIHNDKERRKRFRARQKGFLKKGFYSPSYFSYYVLW
jgi:hypothetical protein